MEKSGDLRWGIAAVNLRGPESADFAKHSTAKDGYIIKSISSKDEVEFRRVRSHVRFADWSVDANEAEQLLSLESVQIVTITVTESGYYTDDTGALNESHPVIASESAGDARSSVYAYLAAALAHRMDNLNAPISILCCDNIRENGKKLEKNFGAYLALLGQDKLADWVTKNVTFPCSMVDRITPRSTPELRIDVEAIFGASSATPIVAEDFHQWVIEDNFATPIPELAAVGATVTSDVYPYEEAKIRILNGGHTCLCYLAALKGIKTFDAAMADPDLNEHFWTYEREEVLPALTTELPFDKSAYLDQIAQRFSNASIADSIERICADGVAKFPIFILPTLEGCLAQGVMPTAGLRSVASWYVFARLIATEKLDIRYLEPSWDKLSVLLDPQSKDSFCTSKLLWADLPDRFPDFPGALSASINELEKTWLA